MFSNSNFNILSNTVISLFSITYFISSFVETAKADAPEAWQTGFQDPATPYMEGMIEFYNFIMLFFNCNFCFYYMDVI